MAEILAELEENFSWKKKPTNKDILREIFRTFLESHRVESAAGACLRYFNTYIGRHARLNEIVQRIKNNYFEEPNERYDVQLGAMKGSV